MSVHVGLHGAQYMVHVPRPHCIIHASMYANIQSCMNHTYTSYIGHRWIPILQSILPWQKRNQSRSQAYNIIWHVCTIHMLWCGHRLHPNHAPLAMGVLSVQSLAYNQSYSIVVHSEFHQSNLPWRGRDHHFLLKLLINVVLSQKLINLQIYVAPWCISH